MTDVTRGPEKDSCLQMPDPILTPSKLHLRRPKEYIPPTKGAAPTIRDILSSYSSGPECHPDRVEDGLRDPGNSDTFLCASVRFLRRRLKKSPKVIDFTVVTAPSSVQQANVVDRLKVKHKISVNGLCDKGSNIASNQSGIVQHKKSCVKPEFQVKERAVEHGGSSILLEGNQGGTMPPAAFLAPFITDTEFGNEVYFNACPYKYTLTTPDYHHCLTQDTADGEFQHWSDDQTSIPLSSYNHNGFKNACLLSQIPSREPSSESSVKYHTSTYQGGDALTNSQLPTSISKNQFLREPVISAITKSERNSISSCSSLYNHLPVQPKEYSMCSNVSTKGILKDTLRFPPSSGDSLPDRQDRALFIKEAQCFFLQDQTARGWRRHFDGHECEIYQSRYLGQEPMLADSSYFIPLSRADSREHQLSATDIRNPGQFAAPSPYEKSVSLTAPRSPPRKMARKDTERTKQRTYDYFIWPDVELFPPVTSTTEVSENGRFLAKLPSREQRSVLSDMYDTSRAKKVQTKGTQHCSPLTKQNLNISRERPLGTSSKEQKRVSRSAGFKHQNPVYPHSRNLLSSQPTVKENVLHTTLSNESPQPTMFHLTYPNVSTGREPRGLPHKMRIQCIELAKQCEEPVVATVTAKPFCSIKASTNVSAIRSSERQGKPARKLVREELVYCPLQSITPSTSGEYRATVPGTGLKQTTMTPAKFTRGSAAICTKTKGAELKREDSGSSSNLSACFSDQCSYLPMPIAQQHHRLKNVELSEEMLVPCGRSAVHTYRGSKQPKLSKKVELVAGLRPPIDKTNTLFVPLSKSRRHISPHFTVSHSASEDELNLPVPGEPLSSVRYGKVSQSKSNYEDISINTINVGQIVAGVPADPKKVFIQQTQSPFKWNVRKSSKLCIRNQGHDVPLFQTHCTQDENQAVCFSESSWSSYRHLIPLADEGSENVAKMSKPKLSLPSKHHLPNLDISESTDTSEHEVCKTAYQDMQSNRKDVRVNCTDRGFATVTSRQLDPSRSKTIQEECTSNFEHADTDWQYTTTYSPNICNQTADLSTDIRLDGNTSMQNDHPHSLTNETQEMWTKHPNRLSYSSDAVVHGIPKSCIQNPYGYCMQAFEHSAEACPDSVPCASVLQEHQKTFPQKTVRGILTMKNSTDRSNDVCAVSSVGGHQSRDYSRHNFEDSDVKDVVSGEVTSNDQITANQTAASSRSNDEQYTRESIRQDSESNDVRRCLNGKTVQSMLQMCHCSSSVLDLKVNEYGPTISESNMFARTVCETLNKKNDITVHNFANVVQSREKENTTFTVDEGTAVYNPTREELEVRGKKALASVDIIAIAKKELRKIQKRLLLKSNRRKKLRRTKTVPRLAPVAEVPEFEEEETDYTTSRGSEQCMDSTGAVVDVSEAETSFVEVVPENNEKNFCAFGETGYALDSIYLPNDGTNFHTTNRVANVWCATNFEAFSEETRRNLSFSVGTESPSKFEDDFESFIDRNIIVEPKYSTCSAPPPKEDFNEAHLIKESHVSTGEGGLVGSIQYYRKSPNTSGTDIEVNTCGNPNVSGTVVAHSTDTFYRQSEGDLPVAPSKSCTLLPAEGFDTFIRKKLDKRYHRPSLDRRSEHRIVFVTSAVGWARISTGNECSEISDTVASQPSSVMLSLCRARQVWRHERSRKSKKRKKGDVFKKYNVIECGNKAEVNSMYPRTRLLTQKSVYTLYKRGTVFRQLSKLNILDAERHSKDSVEEYIAEHGLRNTVPQRRKEATHHPKSSVSYQEHALEILQAPVRNHRLSSMQPTVFSVEQGKLPHQQEYYHAVPQQRGDRLLQVLRWVMESDFDAPGTRNWSEDHLLPDCQIHEDAPSSTEENSGSYHTITSGVLYRARLMYEKWSNVVRPYLKQAWPLPHFGARRSPREGSSC